MSAVEMVLVLTTAPDDERAQSWARSLVDERLAACVNVHGPMTSYYRWQGIVEHATEHQMVIKTTREQRAAVEARLQQLHSYELPECVVVAVEGGSEAYLKWVAAESQGGL